MLQLIGQCGPLLGTRLYPASQAPLYTSGMCVCALAMVVVAFLAVGLRVYLGMVNGREEKGYGRVGEEGGMLAKRKVVPFKFML